MKMLIAQFLDNVPTLRLLFFNNPYKSILMQYSTVIPDRKHDMHSLSRARKKIEFEDNFRIKGDYQSRIVPTGCL